MNKLYINSARLSSSSCEMEWSWPIDTQVCDRSPQLRTSEIAELAYLASRQRDAVPPANPVRETMPQVVGEVENGEVDDEDE